MNITTTLPKDVIDLLAKKAKELNLPKNKIIERALKVYLENIEKAEYAKSYKQASTDTDLLQIAEEGMTDYWKQLNDSEKA
ncbi:ribbon-helix-helix domain-containing protein [Marivirga arenosa]|uniref:Ribbon-helix-helix domain-containing protein n=1 Tax=Marivirga arenosa TaxID=3059076 RepID=A0AA51ZXU3_9BACT|nr:ribbon-helix-helix domain-containing protein [Marivirga sp. BKB1-2]WNB18718.1 ribbon-helix-helix domain-containing protein [Marivirga sp. BKB1-2]